VSDYDSLLTRAVSALENNTDEAREGLYERARAALLRQLRNGDPPASESEIAGHRLALEEAIKRVEAGSRAGASNVENSVEEEIV
jgi:hypothetical protein